MSVHYLAVGGREEAGPPPAALAFNGPNRRQRVRIIAGNFLAFFFLPSLFFRVPALTRLTRFSFFLLFFFLMVDPLSPRGEGRAQVRDSPPPKKSDLTNADWQFTDSSSHFLSYRILAKFSGILSPKSTVCCRETSSALPHFPLRTPQVPLHGVAEFYNAISMTGQTHFFCPLIAWRDACFSWDENPIKPTLMRRGEALFF